MFSVNCMDRFSSVLREGGTFTLFSPGFVGALGATWRPHKYDRWQIRPAPSKQGMTDGR